MPVGRAPLELSRDEVRVIQEIINLETAGVALSPMLFKEWRKVERLGDSYPFRQPDDQLRIGICVDRYPPTPWRVSTVIGK